MGNKKKRHVTYSKNFRYVKLPDLDKISNSYTWDGIKVDYVPNKNKGVLATLDLNPGFLFPYGGLCITDKKTIISRLKHSGRQTNDYSAYFVDSKYDKNNNCIAWLDGHDRLYTASGNDRPKYAWIGSFVNEPSYNETLNAKLVCIPSTKKVPKYPHMDEQMTVFVEVIAPIVKGQEILVDYGWSKTIYKKFNYLPAKFCTPASTTEAASDPIAARKRLKIDYCALHAVGSICLK